ncbi:MAG TPA: undecaprenyldiphospho-muramoylpentapeptide beta-N-acetylglucosaminyltransferase [Clostridia bacterium]|nr:undecaprenyldiphospho-muramoylpentapeptide beta-N-acetylglucosaminyltransferase [Clostridia bacterium]
MKIIVTGGGTGGHVYPALSIADEIKKRYPDVEIIFVGTARGIENRVVPEAGYELKIIDAAGIDRSNMLKNLNVAFTAFRGLRQCMGILREFKPELVIGTGGYVSGPMVFLASLKGLKTCIHEQNAYPGLTNKLLGLSVAEIMTGFETSENYFMRKKRVHYTGNPVRKEFYGIKKNEAREKLGLPLEQFRVLSMGGSGGASVLNEIIKESMKILKNKEIYFTHVTGKRYFDKFMFDLECGNKNEIHSYISEMAIHMAASDIVVSRAGAITVAEILKLGKPSIMIPSPNVTGNHQFHNASALKESGCALLMEEKDLTGQKLAYELLQLYENRDSIASMEKCAECYRKSDATKSIVDRMMNL